MESRHFAAARIVTLALGFLVLLPPSGSQAATTGHAKMVTWSCSGTPCPWGPRTSNPALVWPAALSPLTRRLGYETSAPVYLPARAAMGVKITVNRGRARIYAGPRSATSHRILATLAAGQSHRIDRLYSDEVVSVQADTAFRYTIARSKVPARPLPKQKEIVRCADTRSCEVVESVTAYWRCTGSDCSWAAWVGHVVSWPWWAAYESNDRFGFHSRTVYSAQGDTLYPYMAAWADGCQVTAVTGRVLIVEWQRGTDEWRETLLAPGETHVIDLVDSEDSALIESPDNGSAFSVRLNNCEPKPRGGGTYAGQVPLREVLIETRSPCARRASRRRADTAAFEHERWSPSPFTGASAPYSSLSS